MRDTDHIRKDLLEELYIILAEFYKYPTEDLFLDIHYGAEDNKLRELFTSLGYKYPDITLKGKIDSYEVLKRTYMECFLGVKQPYAPPIESIYKVWTTDPTVEMPMHDKGYLFGDSALHMRYLFEYFQLEIPEEYNNMPDHLTLLLEFLAFIIKNQEDKEIIQFLTDHFDWLEDFKKELSTIDTSLLYIGITEILINVINQELTRLNQMSS